MPALWSSGEERRVDDKHNCHGRGSKPICIFVIFIT